MTARQAKSTPPPVRIGQVYRDRDPRMSSGNRHVRVAAFETRKVHLWVQTDGMESAAVVDAPVAACERVYRGKHGAWQTSVTQRARIRLDRLTSSRFELVEDVTG